MLSDKLNPHECMFYKYQSCSKSLHEVSDNLGLGTKFGAPRCSCWCGGTTCNNRRCSPIVSCFCVHMAESCIGLEHFDCIIDGVHLPRNIPVRMWSKAGDKCDYWSVSYAAEICLSSAL